MGAWAQIVKRQTHVPTRIVKVQTIKHLSYIGSVHWIEANRLHRLSIQKKRPALDVRTNWYNPSFNFQRGRELTVNSLRPLGRIQNIVIRQHLCANRNLDVARLSG